MSQTPRTIYQSSNQVPCPLCRIPMIEQFGADGRLFRVCPNESCRFNYNNQSRNFDNPNVNGFMGFDRKHAKLSNRDYVQVQFDATELTIGGVARKWGISRRHVRRILNLNLSRYAEKFFGEQPVSEET